MQATNFIFILFMVSGTGKVKRKVPTTVVPGDQIVPITVSCYIQIYQLLFPATLFLFSKEICPHLLTDLHRQC